MPKDASKNVDRYKVRGGHLNEFEFQQDKATDKKQMNTDKARREKKPTTGNVEKNATAGKAAKKKSQP
jgi:hypothetical protein